MQEIYGHIKYLKLFFYKVTPLAYIHTPQSQTSKVPPYLDLQLQNGTILPILSALCTDIVVSLSEHVQVARTHVSYP